MSIKINHYAIFLSIKYYIDVFMAGKDLVNINLLLNKRDIILYLKL